MFNPAYTFEMMLRTRRFWGSAAKALRREEGLSCALGRPSFSTDEKPAVTVSIDRTGLYNPEPHSHDLDPRKEPETALAKQLKALIRVEHNCPCQSSFLPSLRYNGGKNALQNYPSKGPQ